MGRKYGRYERPVVIQTLKVIPWRWGKNKPMNGIKIYVTTAEGREF